MPPGETPGPRPRRLLGEILLDEGLITRRELEAALRLQAEQRTKTPIGQLLVAQGALRQAQLDAVLDKYRLGNLLLETGAITQEQLDAALRQQKLTGRRLGEVLLQLRYITEPQLRHALAAHLGIRMVVLDDVALDPRLALLIDCDSARRCRLVPIGRPADRVIVAMDDPGDQQVIATLRRALGCQIEVVTATGTALRRAFSRLYGQPLDLPEGRPAGDAPLPSVQARHTETVRILAAVRSASERVRQNLAAGSVRGPASIDAPADPGRTPPSPAPGALPPRPSA